MRSAGAPSQVWVEHPRSALRIALGWMFAIAAAGGIWVVYSQLAVPTGTAVSSLASPAIATPAAPKSEATPSPDKADVAPSGATGVTDSSAIDWSRFCRPAPIRAPGPSVVHRWRDAQGILHYSNAAPPADALAPAQIVAMVPPGAGISIEGFDTPLPAFARDRLLADTQAVLQVLRVQMGVDLDRSMRIDAVVVADPAHFDALRAAAAPGLAPVDGFYDPQQRRVVVRRGDDDAQTRAVLRHEAVHAIAHETIGPMPTWLSEGLAELFEHSRTEGMGLLIDPAPEWRATLKQIALDERLLQVDRALSATHEQFHGNEVQAMYASSWAIVYQLMSTATGRDVLRELLAVQRATPECRVADLRSELDRLMPGRLDGLLVAIAQSVDAPAPAALQF